MSQYKYFFVFLVVIVSIVSAGVAMSAPLTNLANKHNLSSAATHGGPQAQVVATGGTDQICVFCHTPHSATPESPLWSRPDPNGTFPLYGQQLVIKGDYPGSPVGSQDRSQYKIDVSVTYPSGASRLCLSCHDGVTAMGILSDGTSIAMLGGQDFVTGTFVIDLSTSHPISFVYDNAVLSDINTARPGTTYQLPLNLTVLTPLDGENKMQCTTCHDPHEDTNLDSLGLPFWRHTATPVVAPYDDVCNACHIGGSPGLPGGDHNPGPGI